MQKRLKFGNPILSYEPCVSHLTGIINSDYERFQNALYNNFIDITIKGAANFSQLKDWTQYDMFEIYKIPKAALNNFQENNIINMIKTWINQENYILISFETFYISNYCTSHKERIKHFAMIMGYNEEQSSFFCGDFFDFKYYTVEQCLMCEVVQAIRHNTDQNGLGYTSDFTLLRIKDNAIPRLNINKIIMSLNMLLVENNIRYQPIYGLNLFNRIYTMIELGTLNDMENDFKRHAQFLVVHMEAMLMRTQYLSKIFMDKRFIILIESIQYILNETKKFRNYILKKLYKGDFEFSENKKKENIHMLQNIKMVYELIIKQLAKVLSECKYSGQIVKL